MIDPVLLKAYNNIKFNPWLVLLPCFVPVVFCGLAGRFLPPIGIIVSPLVGCVTTPAIIVLAKGFDVIIRIFCCFVFVTLCDVSIKLYAGGDHDNEGYGLVNLFFIAGAAFSLIIIIAAMVFESQTPVYKRIIAAICFPVLIAVYLHYCAWLGLGISYR